MKKVLIITYYWPPSGGAGVQRWLKFSKYLPQFGWQPVIYTPKNGEIPVVDESLFKDVPKEAIVIKAPIWEPYSFYKKFIGQRKEEKINAGFLSESKKSSLLQKIAVWIRGNFFIPDARKFWIKPSIKFLTHYLEKNPVDIIISTGPPHSMHLIALGLKEKFKHIPWIADFRDPWTNIDFYQDLMLTKWADKKHKKLEQQIITKASYLITVGETMKEELIALGAINIEVITNGYDDEDLNKEKVELDKKFSIAHIGTLVKSRNPHILWQVLSEIVKQDDGFASDLQIKLVGKLDIEVLQTIQQFGLNEYLFKIEYLTHDKVIVEQQRSQVLLLIINDTKNSKGILTGKFFEYLAAKRPILGIGPIHGDAAKILEKTGAGKISGYQDSEGLKKNILSLYSSFKHEKFEIETQGIEKYSRKSLARDLSNLMLKC